MNFKFNSIVLALALAFASSFLLDGVTAVDQQQLRGSPDDNNSPQRNMAGMVCPALAPTNGTSCAGVLPSGFTNGGCEWHHSAWDTAGTKTTTIDRCSCPGQQGSWSCSKDIETVTSPPVPSPPPATAPAPISSWCPPAPASTGDVCTLPAGKTSGSCTNWSTTAKKVTTETVCTCKSASPTFDCKQTTSN